MRTTADRRFIAQLLAPLPESEAGDDRAFLFQIRQDEGRGNHRLFLLAMAAAHRFQTAIYGRCAAGTRAEVGEWAAKKVIAEKVATEKIGAFISSPSRNYDDLKWKREVLRTFGGFGGDIKGGRQEWKALLAEDEAWLAENRERIRARRAAVKSSRRRV